MKKELKMNKYNILMIQINRKIMHKKYNKFVVERVYLYQTNMVEFVFANKIRRKFKGIEPSHTFHDPAELVKPRQGLDGSIEWT
jgi:predicted transposase YbfD/YdcC